MLKIMSRSALYSLPLSLALSCLATFLLFQDNNNNEIYITDTNIIDYNYLILEFSSMFILSYACQFVKFVALGMLLSKFPDR